MLQGTQGAKRKARELRKDMTLPEVLLWQQLKRRPGGMKFRRQHSAGHYVLDFYCHEARLIVEVDGIAHEMGARPERDSERDRHFQGKGLRVMRIPATEILRDPQEVAASIAAAAGPPLRAGEE